MCQDILTGHHSYVAVYSSQGDQIASASEDHTVRLRSVITGTCQHTLSGHLMTVVGIAYSPNGSLIATGSRDRTVRLWIVETGECKHILDHDALVEKVVFSPQGNILASVDENSIVRLWDVETGNYCHALAKHGDSDSIAFSPSSNFILSTLGEVGLWDAATGEYLWPSSNMTSTFAGDWKPSTAGWIASDMDSFATGGRDGSVRVWDVIKEGGQCRVRMRWRSTGHLNVEEACIQDVEGLSHLNKRLLEQRGALRIPEADNMVATMGSVVSKFMSSLTRKGQDLSASSDLLSGGSLEQ